MNPSIAPVLNDRMLRLLSAFSPGQQDAVSRFAPKFVAAALALALAWQLVEAIGAYGGGQIQSASAALASTRGDTTPGEPQANVDAIVGAHLFGVASPASDAVDMTATPTTQVPLALTGTVALEDPLAGFAIIGEGGVTRLYRVGTEIRPNIRLHSVYRDRVLLYNLGQLETLFLPKEGDPLAPGTPTAAMAANAQTGSVGVRNLAFAAGTVSTPRGAFAGAMSAQAVVVNGALRGYRVFPSRKSKGFSSLGLMQGDVVTAINGVPVVGTAGGKGFFESLGGAQSAVVTVERNGSIQELVLNAENLPVSNGQRRAATN